MDQSLGGNITARILRGTKNAQCTISGQNGRDPFMTVADIHSLLHTLFCSFELYVVTVDITCASQPVKLSAGESCLSGSMG